MIRRTVMRIEWMAHACFKVTLDSGKVIVFDPYDESVGYKSAKIDADIVLISHNHRDHACLKNICGDYRLINSEGDFEVDGVKIRGIKSVGEKTDGDDKGTNRVYKVEAESIKLLHLGDIGHIPDEDFVRQVGDVDIMFVPVGGRYTVDGKEALEICKMFDPNLIIPMHYKTLFLELDLDTVFPFTDAAGTLYDRSHIVNSSFEITASNLKKRTRIIVMEASMEE